MKEKIIEYLEGRDQQKYIVAVETSYGKKTVDLIISEPSGEKRIETHKYKPFLWVKPEVFTYLYDGDRHLIREKLKKYSITLKKLKTTDENGYEADRMKTGFTLLAEGNCTYGELINFFKYGGVDIFDKEFRRYFITFSIQEQFLIQTGKRLFKGYDDYNDIHRFSFDLETTGLDPKRHSIFAIGIKTNRGEEIILEIEGETEEELLNKEAQAIETFFRVIGHLKPDVISGFNSENFDFEFLKVRCEVLNIDFYNIAKGLDNETSIRRKHGASVKYGQETEFYTQTLLYGYNIVDTHHAVRRAQAINSEIKKTNLKYITKFAKINKPNRVYIKGDRIPVLWADLDNDYAFNDADGSWYRITERNPLEANYGVVSGKYIVNRYLLDDLWETEHVDFKFNQATFLLSKIIPTTYSKTSTMGTASVWKLIMAGWSYENNLAIPDYQEKRKFTGGLSRLFKCGFVKAFVKLDFAALYPNIELTWGIFPDFDITKVMEYLLLYIAETRDDSKTLKNKHIERIEEIQEGLRLYEKEGKLTPELKKKINMALDKHGKIADDADKKQLPIKILANSFFGSLGAPHIFPWGDMDCAEETTCRGRQYLRLLVNFFKDKYGFIPLVLDTDGVNFEIPDNIDNFTYISDGTHRFNEKGKEYRGIKAAVAEFNDIHMDGRMGLDIDEIGESTINCRRKNYADLIKGKIKLVGNSIKSKGMEEYIEEFLDGGISLLLRDEGQKFIEYYNDYVEKIYNYQIPINKIASKSKVKQSVSEYLKGIKTLTKAGNPKSRQAHMELIINENIKVDLGDTIYYINTGTKKSHGDVKTVREKDGTRTVNLNCQYIPIEHIEEGVVLDDVKYNVLRYLDKLNKRIYALFVVFNPDIRKKILRTISFDRKTGAMVLSPRQSFTKKECELVSGMPLEESHQDCLYKDFMVMEDKEIHFWLSVDKIPNNIDIDYWNEVVIDYKLRLEKTRIKNLEIEKFKLYEKIKSLDDDAIHKIRGIECTVELDNTIMDGFELLLSDDGYFVSPAWDEKLVGIEILFDNTLLGEFYNNIDMELVKSTKWFEINYPEEDEIEEELIIDSSF